MRHTVALALVALAHGGTNEFGKTFLEENKAKPGVVTLPSGLQYKVIDEGDGDAHPLGSTDCTCHYEGRTAQEFSKEPKGKTFDSSLARGEPSNFAPSGVIAGWTEAMKLMVEGDKWELYIPSELAYGDSGQGGDIGAGDVLVFTLHLMEINGPTREAEPKGPPPYTLLGDGADQTSFDAWSATSQGAHVKVLAVLRQPMASSKLFQGFKHAARLSAKDDDGYAYAISAASKFVKGKYTTDPIAERLKLSPQAVYLQFEKASEWNKCTIGRPTEMSIEQISQEVVRCVLHVATGKTTKTEL